MERQPNHISVRLRRGDIEMEIHIDIAAYLPSISEFVTKAVTDFTKLYPSEI
jgi:hypothetical protein